MLADIKLWITGWRNLLLCTENRKWLSFSRTVTPNNPFLYFLTPFLAREDLKDIVITSNVNSYFQNLLTDPLLFQQKLHSLSHSNCEELYFAIKALQHEFIESVDLVFDLFDLKDHQTGFAACRRPEDLYRRIRKTMRKYLTFDYFSFKIQDLRSGIFYELKSKPTTPKNQSNCLRVWLTWRPRQSKWRKNKFL